VVAVKARHHPAARRGAVGGIVVGRAEAQEAARHAAPPAGHLNGALEVAQRHARQRRAEALELIGGREEGLDGAGAEPLGPRRRDPVFGEARHVGDELGGRDALGSLVEGHLAVDDHDRAQFSSEARGERPEELRRAAVGDEAEAASPRELVRDGRNERLPGRLHRVDDDRRLKNVAGATEPLGDRRPRARCHEGAVEQDERAGSRRAHALRSSR
jgi:hypothetical protein